MRKLDKDEIKEISTLSTVNEKKSKIQELIIKEWLQVKKGILIAYTSFGKNFTFLKIINLFNLKRPDFTILIIVPRQDLKSDIEKSLIQYNLKNVEVCVINTLANRLVKGNKRQYYDLVLGDECHSLAGNSEYFSEILNYIDCKYLFLCSATLTESHLKFLKGYNLEVFFEVPIEIAYKLELIPTYQILNISIELTYNEKVKYAALMRDYQYYISLFSQHDLLNPVGCIMSVLSGKKGCKYNGIHKSGDQHASDIAESLNLNKGQVIGLGFKWRSAMIQRNAILNKAENSIKLTKELTEYIKDQCLVFCSNIEVADELAKESNGKAFHSKIPVKKRVLIKEDFMANKVKNLYVVNSLKEGFDYRALKYTIRSSFNSTKLDLTQILGRNLRFNSEDEFKISTLIHIYAEDFTLNEITYKSQTKIWLMNACKNRSFVQWIKDKSEIKLN